jgi:ABC-type branched-subunit amino acid transport system substrate-binding protein
MKAIGTLAIAASLALGIPAWGAETPGVTATEILIGHDVDLSGAIAVRMKTLNQASDAYIERVNNAGGVNGRRIRIIRMDSGNKPDKTTANVKKLVESDGVFAMWAISGTGNVAAALPYLEAQKVPLIGSTSGADPFYDKLHPMLINLKAGYGDEIRRSTAHLRDTFIRKIAIVYMDNGFGREAFKTAQAAAKENNLEVVGTASFKEDGSDIATSIKPLAERNAPAVLLLTLAGPAPKVVEAYMKSATLSPQFVALSIVASDSLYKALGEKARGVIVTQIVPFPWDRAIPLIRDYQDVVRAKGVTEFSPAGVEGYILARALVEGLQAAGKNPTRESLIRAFEKMRDKDLGGLTLNFSPSNHNGSRLVEITMIGKEGRLVR